MAQKRITKEFRDITTDKPPGILCSLVDESNVHHWKVILDGPEGSPYVGAKFELALSLPTEYPFKPPTLNFRTRIYHPNITNDEKGSMCIGILKSESWKPSSKILSVLMAVQDLLREPVPDDALEAAIADVYKTDRARYDKEAKEGVKRWCK